MLVIFSGSIFLPLDEPMVSLREMLECDPAIGISATN
jgi:hypothetical protein